ncbi:MAG: DNA adenine methylase [Bacilli bacterium]|nr:DNA adenine methylase [Bacilli bacterium]
MICQFCGTEDMEYFQIDSYNKGFWCEDCDGYNYIGYNREERDKFILILENKSNKETTAFTSDISFKKQLSPLRYPGGKSKLIDYISTKLDASKLDIFVEPFCGGGSVSLSLLDAGVIKELILNDLDYGVYSLFYTIKYEPYKLINKIKDSQPTHNDYFNAQRIIKSNYNDCGIFDAAWSLLIVNRLAYSGIYKANPLGGKNGSIDELLNRWSPKALIKRILHIHSMSDKITVLSIDACELIEEMYWNDKATIFIDPPYFRKGKDLYNCYYTKEDHIRLNILLDNLYQGMPGANMIVTYDDDKYIKDLYLYPHIEKIGRVYSI